jgi:hypothetical protein
MYIQLKFINKDANKARDMGAEIEQEIFDEFHRVAGK